MQFDLIIPAYRPDEKLEQLVGRVVRQTVKPGRIIVVNTEEKYWKPLEHQPENLELLHISKEEFDHGGTRRMAAGRSGAEFFVCMTQDAVPADSRLFERLLEPFQDAQVGAAYARQLARGQAGVAGAAREKTVAAAEAARRKTVAAAEAAGRKTTVAELLERYTRQFNYPPESRVKTKADLPVMGIKTWFCSDVCAAYRKSAYELAGGFVERAIFNEDMLMAAALMEEGYAVAYAAEARVWHSHYYTAGQQLHRNFDLGVSHREYRDVFGQVSSESEGIRMVKQAARYLCENGKAYGLPVLFAQSAAKFAGYRLGKCYDRLPSWLVRRLTASPGYFKYGGRGKGK